MVILADVLVVQHVLYVLHVLCLKINSGTKAILKSNDRKKYVRRNVAQNGVLYLQSRIIRQCKFETHIEDDFK